MHCLCVRCETGLRINLNLPFLGNNNIISDLSLPSCAAAPPGMILVIKMLGSSPMWGLSVPPAILKPRPEFPCREGKKQNKNEKMSTDEITKKKNKSTLKHNDITKYKAKSKEK